MEIQENLAKIQQELSHLRDTSVTREEFESAMETMAILSNPDTMKQIRESEKDIKAGRVNEIKSVKDL